MNSINWKSTRGRFNHIGRGFSYIESLLLVFAHQEIDLKTYAKYILKEGTNEEKRELMGCFRSKLKITKGMVELE
jgi:hypothetical protein